ncbi:MAG: prephenate dehydrogenase/arogenate dehydrogenase family protein [Gemmataceae bacterium]
MDTIDTLAIIGVGLMGASVGLAAKSRGLARRIIGFDSDPEHLRIAEAYEGIETTNVRIQDAQLIIVCTPVDRIAAEIVRLEGQIPPSAVITDLGSTKQRIVEAVELSSIHNQYVGSHPMAGSEKKGPAFANPELFAGRPVILTPTARTQEQPLKTVSDFWTALGCRVVRMSPKEHDAAVAAVSHLPHAVASALAGCTDISLVPVSAGGWRDTTRVAGAGPGIWTPIFRENRDAVIAALHHFSDHLASFRRLLEADDGPGITAWLADAKRVRDALGS